MNIKNCMNIKKQHKHIKYYMNITLTIYKFLEIHMNTNKMNKFLI